MNIWKQEGPFCFKQRTKMTNNFTHIHAFRGWTEKEHSKKDVRAQTWVQRSTEDSDRCVGGKEQTAVVDDDQPPRMLLLDGNSRCHVFESHNAHGDRTTI